MKLILMILSILFTLFNCKAQSPILDMEVDTKYDARDNSYYKDINNVLNDFEGTWLFENGKSSLKIVLVKSVQSFNGDFYEDLLIGGYQYIDNGLEKINTLSDASEINIGRNASIKGNNITYGCKYLPVDDCSDNEKYMDLSIKDIPANGHFGDLIISKRTVDGQEAIKINIEMNYMRIGSPDGTTPDPTLPWQIHNMILIKQ